jgi:hypothetical protein
MTHDLPPLPEPESQRISYGCGQGPIISTDGYSSSQIQSYALAAIAPYSKLLSDFEVGVLKQKEALANAERVILRQREARKQLEAENAKLRELLAVAFKSLNNSPIKDAIDAALKGKP